MITLLVGGRASGKTHTAIERAKASGKNWIVLSPTRIEADAMRRSCPDGLWRSIRTVYGRLEWDLIVIDGAERTRKRDALRIIGRLKDRGADLLITANLNGDGCKKWVRRLAESGVVLVEELK